MKHLSRYRIIIPVLSLGLVLALFWVVPDLTTAQTDNDPTAVHKEMVRRVFEDLWNGENLESAIDLYAPDSTLHSPNSSNTHLFHPTCWRDDVFPAIHGAFPDLEVNIEHMIAEDDMVVVHYTAQGMFEKDIETPGENPLHASGEEATWDGLSLYRFEDERIVEVWWYWDNSLFAKADVCFQ